MSLFNQPYRCLVMLAVLFMGTACDYRPLHGYGGAEKSQSLQAELSKVWIPVIKDREGQQLRNALIALFQPSLADGTPKYALKITYQENSIGASVATNDYATRANLNIVATFSLSGPAALQGTSQSVASYNILNVATATEFSRRTARERAIDQIAQDIHRRIGIHLVNTAQKPL